MSTPCGSSQTVGYKHDFVEQVSTDYTCKLCKYVAKEPTIVSCCGECFCKACIQTVKQDCKACPFCDQNEFGTFFHAKYQRTILSLPVSCTMKDHGCTWSGELRQVESHISDNCDYIAVQCPNSCSQTVLKMDVETHLSNSCLFRKFVCPHCNFKGSFQDVTEKHYKVCLYYPLRCPNLCGVTCERELIEDHMKMCRLEVVHCAFGCGVELVRDDQDTHMEQNTQKHLTLIAATTSCIKREQQKYELRLQEQQEAFESNLNKQLLAFESRLTEQREEFGRKLSDLGEKFKTCPPRYEGERNVEEEAIVHEQPLRDDLRIEQLEKEFSDKYRLLEEQLKKKDSQIESLKVQLQSQAEHLRKNVKFLHFHESLPSSIDFTNFRLVKSINSSMDSLPMYTHPGGYRFKLKIFPNGLNEGKGSHVSVCVLGLKGDHDAELSFPARFIVSLQLLNQRSDRDHYTKVIECATQASNRESEQHSSFVCVSREGNPTLGKAFTGVVDAIFRAENAKYFVYDLDSSDTQSGSYIGSHWKFVSHYALESNKKTEYLQDDCLKFRITDISGPFIL